MAIRRPIIRHKSQVEAVPCPCGHSTRIFTQKDDTQVGLHVTDLGGAQKHKHTYITEVYYITAGQGQMELDDTIVDVSAGHAIYIPAGIAHRAIGEFQAVIVTIPPFDPADEHLCD